MKKIVEISVVAMMIILIAALQSCKKEDELTNEFKSSSAPSPELKSQVSNVFYGPTIPMGNGVARAWVQENTTGEPMAVGINLSEKALQNLPSEPAQFVLYFPRNKGMNFYKHMLVDWNPNGHEPPGVYDLPHFDFHFYTITNEERLTIGPAGAPQFDVLPAPQYIPPAYVKIPGGVPEMGAHWADVLSPEFNGGTFTKTFILGSWDGSFIFYEPMITMSYLLSHPDEILNVRQPSAYQHDGWYPSNYQVSFTTSPKEYTVALLNLSYHEGQ
jgi:hypothetical protein